MKGSNDLMVLFLDSDVYSDYRSICFDFYENKVDKTLYGYDKFLESVGIKAINEATKNPDKTYPADGRFYNLLGWRYALYLKDAPSISFTDNFNYLENANYFVQSKNEESTVKSFSENKISLKKVEFLTTSLIKEIDNKKFKPKQIAIKFNKIAKQFNITHFLGIALDEFDCLVEAKQLKKQLKNYHNNKYNAVLSSTINNIIFEEMIETTEAIELYRKGEIYMKKAFELEYLDLKKDIISLFKCFLNYLTASYCYKEANELEPNLFLSKYNYAYVIKRLGFFNESLADLKALNNLKLDDNESLLVNECIGDLYLIISKNKIKEKANKQTINLFVKNSLSYFNNALKFAPNDQQIIFNIIETLLIIDDFNESNSNLTNVLNKLKVIVAKNQKLPKQRIELLENLKTYYTSSIKLNNLLNNINS